MRGGRRVRGVAASQQIPATVPEDAERLQRLNALLEQVVETNAFQRERLHHLVPLESLEGLRALPFTTKHDLVADQAAHPPFGTNLTFPVERYTHLHQTSGTSGTTLRVLDTPEDWAWWRHNLGVVFRAAGVGPDDRVALAGRLAGAGITRLVDVRRFPGSRSNPDVRREALEEWLPGAGISYRWDARLGGRRALPRGEPVADAWWTVAQFAAYAAHTRTPEFAGALDEVLAEARDAVVAVMCSEYVWWRCHRRLIADVAVLGRGVAVRHVMPDGRLADHRPSEGAVVDPTGLLTWP